MSLKTPNPKPAMWRIISNEDGTFSIVNMKYNQIFVEGFPSVFDATRFLVELTSLMMRSQKERFPSEYLTEILKPGVN